MCGRGTQRYSWDEVREYLTLLPSQPSLNLEPRYNVAPTTQVDVVREVDGQRELVKMRWGLIPSWWNKPLRDMKFSTFNAKVETVRESPTFRTAWRGGQRCVVPFCFYEWKRPRAKGQAPFYIYPKHAPMFLIAGLWDEWTDRETGEVILSCTIITVLPNDFMSTMHDRMPAILGEGQLDEWFRSPSATAFDMLKPCPSEWMTCRGVGNYVNNVRNQGAQCVEPMNETEDLL